MTTPHLTAQLEHVVQAAALAPGSDGAAHPWRFALRDDGFDLHTTCRVLPVHDADSRQLHLSCGAAVVTARVAARALGLAASAQLLPEPGHPSLLARVRMTSGPSPDDDELALALAVLRRHPVGSGFQDRPLPEPLLAELCRAAQREGVVLRHLRPGGGPAALAQASCDAAAPARREPPVVVLSTPGDDRTAWLRAGQAVGAVLLRTAAAGVQAQSVDHVTERSGGRRALAEALGTAGMPQLVLRLGYPAASPAAACSDVQELAS